MPETPRRERRSPMVVLLDAAMRLAIAAQSGPEPKLRPAGRPRRVTTAWLVAGSLLAVAGTAVLIGALLTGPLDLTSLPPHTAARQPAAPAPESAPTTSTGSAASATPTAAATTTTTPTVSTTPGRRTETPSPAAPGIPPEEVPLTARYAYADGGTGLLGYTADVAVSNPGPAGRDGWQLTVTLPRPTLQITGVSGAAARQDGSTWTFEPDDSTRTVPPGGSVRISFQVRGATLLDASPRECRIDGRPCAGVGGSAPSTR